VKRSPWHVEQVGNDDALADEAERRGDGVNDDRQDGESKRLRHSVLTRRILALRDVAVQTLSVAASVLNSCGNQATRFDYGEF
jgi:hypothetical protein